MYPGAHAPQSIDESYFDAHMPHAAPLHMLRQVHAHPLCELPLTHEACQLQFQPTVHVR